MISLGMDRNGIRKFCGGVCFLSESSATNEMKIRLPETLMSEIERVAEQDKVTRNELIYRATKTYIRERNIRQNRESMRRGYMEMAKINLNISSEAQYAEFEAENTVERLVSGG